jgi:hypothetical protein
LFGGVRALERLYWLVGIFGLTSIGKLLRIDMLARFLKDLLKFYIVWSFIASWSLNSMFLLNFYFRIWYFSFLLKVEAGSKILMAGFFFSSSSIYLFI